MFFIKDVKNNFTTFVPDLGYLVGFRMEVIHLKFKK